MFPTGTSRLSTNLQLVQRDRPMLGVIHAGIVICYCETYCYILYILVRQVHFHLLVENRVKFFFNHNCFLFKYHHPFDPNVNSHKRIYTDWNAVFTSRFSFKIFTRTCLFDVLYHAWHGIKWHGMIIYDILWYVWYVINDMICNMFDLCDIARDMRGNGGV